MKLTEKNNAEAPTLADDLSERLRSWAQNEEMIDSYYTTHGRDCNEAAARIESDARVFADLAASRERERALREAIKCGHDGEPCGNGVCCHCGEPYETRNESDDGPYLCDQCAQDAIGRFRALATPGEAK